MSAGTVLSVFSGAGGLDLGLERAGFEPVACFEVDSSARRTLAKNRPDWFVPADGDVTSAAKRFPPSMLGLQAGELDLLAGGPPCQPFSKAAQWSSTARLGMSDPRFRPVLGMFDLVRDYLPRAILIENVAGFLSGKDNALPTLQRSLDQINAQTGSNYSLINAVLDAADYGVPQHRKRAIAVAFREPVPYVLPDPTHRGEPVRAWDALHDYVEEAAPASTGSWTGLLPSIPEGQNYQWLTAKGGGTEMFGWRTRYWSFLLKLAKDRPAWTLPASPGPNTGPFHWDNRPLSVRERMRLQSFPDEWSFSGTDREQYKQAGNATPPLLAEVIGLSLATALGRTSIASGSDLGRPSLLRARQAIVPPPVSPLPVPRNFLSFVGPREPHPGEGLGPAPRQLMAAL